jgi:hypothetical protein
VLPLRLTVPTAGSYSLTAAALNLLTGLRAYLRDLSTGQQQLLGSQPLQLTLPAGLSTGYALAFASATALAAAPQLMAAQVVVFPNPALRGTALTVSLPANAAQVATATVLDALGRPVLANCPCPQQLARLPARCPRRP